MGIFPVHIVDISSLNRSFHACVNVLKFKLYLHTLYTLHQLLLHVVCAYLQLEMTREPHEPALRSLGSCVVKIVKFFKFL